MIRLVLAVLASCLVFSAQQPDREALAQKAVTAERTGDFPAAISAFQQLIREGGDSPELRTNLGIAYFQLHEYGDALRQFRLALAKNSDSVPANLFSGLSLLKLEHPRVALPYLETAHRLKPDAPEILLALAQAEVASNDLVRARVSYKQATLLDQASAEAWYGLGIIERALAERELKSGSSEHEEARALMNSSEQAVAKALQLDPSSVHAHMILGESFRIAERYSQAVQEYKAATEQQPKLAAAWAGLAASYGAQGDDANALAVARQALALDPNDAATTALMAAALLRQGNYPDAELYAREALKLQPNLAPAHIVLAKIDLARHEPEKALPDLRSAARNDTDGSANYLLATTLRQLGKRDEAAAAMQTYKKLHAARIGTGTATP